MKSTQSHFSILSRAGFFILIAALAMGMKGCFASSNTAIKPSETLVKLESKQAAIKGQVVESGPYHLELVPEKANNGVHLDLFVQKGDNHQPIPNAKVAGQVQLPDGKQKNLTFTYDVKGKHYTTLLTEKATGQYQLKIASEINGQKVNARFSFKQ